MSKKWVSPETALPNPFISVLVWYNNENIDDYAVAFYGARTREWIEPISGQCLDVKMWREISSPLDKNKE